MFCFSVVFARKFSVPWRAGRCFALAVVSAAMISCGGSPAGDYAQGDIASDDPAERLLALQSAIDLFHLENLRLPTSEEGLGALIEKPGDIAESDWYGPYLAADSVPKDPWGNEFRYKSPGEEGREYDLWSAGPDGADGTGDDLMAEAAAAENAA